jgi:hypothetical protein
MKVHIIILLAVAAMFFSCSVDEFDIVENNPEIYEPEVVYVNDIMAKARSSSMVAGLEIECISVPFPFQVIDIDNKTYLISSKAQFDDLTLDTSVVVLDFVYPLNIIDNIGVGVVVQDLWSFASYAAGCFPVDIPIDSTLFPAYVISKTNSCYRIDYPIQVMTSDLKKIGIVDEQTFIQKHAAEKLFFLFPFNVINSSGTALTVGSPSDLHELLIDCNGGIQTDSSYLEVTSYEFIGCVELIYPINVNVFGTNTPVIVADTIAMGHIFDQGRFENFIYPLSVRKFGDSTIVVHSDDELAMQIFSCFELQDFLILIGGTELLGDGCYDLVFPISVTNANNELITITDNDQILSAFNSGIFLDWSLEYPFDIIVRANNQQVTISSVFEILDIVSNCE